MTNNSIKMDKKRYFIVAYNHANGKIHGSGQTNFVTDGHYLNRLETTEQIKSTLKGDDLVVAIQNIIELSEEDYKDWINE